MNRRSVNKPNFQSEMDCTYCAEFFHIVNDGLAVLDFSQGSNDRFIEVNDVFCNMLEYTREELLALSPIDISPEDAKQDMKCFIDRQKAGFDRKFTKEIVFLAKNDRRIPIELSGHVVEIDGRLIGFGIHHDITKRKIVEKEIKSQYENEVHLRQELEHQMNQRIEFARALVHEIKTSFTPILCNSQVLTNTVSDETSLRLARNIFRSALNLSNRIDEHFDLIRGEIGILKLEKTWINPSSLLNELVSEFSTRALLNEIVFLTDISTHLPPLWADVERLRQVVLNLLDNAIKYSHSDIKIQLRASYYDDKLHIFVEDNGPGISPEDKERVFQSYYQSGANPNKAGGLGLGLALCKYFVELHGGQIRITNGKFKGSIFHFYIPYNGITPPTNLKGLIK